MPLRCFPIGPDNRPVLYSIDDAWFHKGINGIHSILDLIDVNSSRTFEGLQEQLRLLRRRKDYMSGRISGDAECLSILCDFCMRYDFCLVLAGFEYLKERFFDAIEPKGRKAAILLDVGRSNPRQDSYGAEVLDTIVKQCIAKTRLPLVNIFFFSSKLEQIRKYIGTEVGNDGIRRWILDGYRVVEKLPYNGDLPVIEQLEAQRVKVLSELGCFFSFFDMMTKSRSIHEDIRATIEQIVGDEQFDEGHVDDPSKLEELTGLPLRQRHIELVRKSESDSSFKALYCFRGMQEDQTPRDFLDVALLKAYLQEAGIVSEIQPGVPQEIILPVKPGCLFLHNLIQFLQKLKTLDGVAIAYDDRTTKARIDISFKNPDDHPARTLLNGAITGGGQSSELLRRLLSCNPKSLLHDDMDARVRGRIYEWLYLRGEGNKKDILAPLLEYGVDGDNLVLQWSSSQTGS